MDDTNPIEAADPNRTDNRRFTKPFPANQPVETSRDSRGGAAASAVCAEAVSGSGCREVASEKLQPEQFWRVCSDGRRRRAWKCRTLRPDEVLLSAEDSSLLKLKLWRARNGYAHVNLKPIHRIVAERAVCRALLPGEIVDHINHNKLDNRRENLRITNSSGNRRAGAARTAKVEWVGQRGRWKWSAIVCGAEVSGLSDSVEGAQRAFQEWLTAVGVRDYSDPLSVVALSADLPASAALLRKGGRA